MKRRSATPGQQLGHRADQQRARRRLPNLVVDGQREGDRVGVGDLLGCGHPRPYDREPVARFAHAAILFAPQREVEAEAVPGDQLRRVHDGHVRARTPDDDDDLRFVIEAPLRVAKRDDVLRADERGAGLQEETHLVDPVNARALMERPIGFRLREVRVVVHGRADDSMARHRRLEAHVVDERSGSGRWSIIHARSASSCPNTGSASGPPRRDGAGCRGSR